MTDRTIKVVIDPSGAEQGAARVNKALSSVGQSAESAGKQTESISNNLNNLGGSSSNLSNKLMGLGVGMAKVGAAASIFGSLPLGKFMQDSIKESMEAKHAMGQVEAALKSMGNASGKTAKQLEESANKMEMNSLYEADEILTKVSANLLTFGAVSGEVFDKAQQAALDLSARLGTDLQGSTIMLGKALQDPVKGISALSRVGLTFSEDQKKMIEKLVETGQTAKAQGIILDAVNTQVAGSAKKAADADPYKKMRDSMKSLQQTAGDTLVKILPALTNLITGLTNAFTSLSPQMQTIVLGAVGLATVFGPILAGLGGLVTLVGAAIPVFAGMGLTLGGVLLPLTAIAVAVGAVYLAWKNWDTITETLTNLWVSFKSAIVDGVNAALTTAKDIVTGYFDLWKSAAEIVGGAVSAVYTAVKTWIGDKISAVINGIKVLIDGNIAVWNFLKTTVVNAVSGIYNGIKNYLQDKLHAIFDWLKGKLQAVGAWFYDLYDSVVGHSYIPDMVDGIQAEIARLDGVMVKPIEQATKKAKDAFKDLKTDAQGILDGLYPDQAALRAIEQKQDTLKKAQKAKLYGDDVINPALGKLDDEARAIMARRLAEDLPDVVKEGLEKPLIDMSGDTVRDWLTKYSNVNQDITKDFYGEMSSAISQLGQSFAQLFQGKLGKKIGGALEGLGKAVDIFGKMGSTKPEDWTGAGSSGAVTGMIDSMKKMSGTLTKIFGSDSKTGTFFAGLSEKLGQAGMGAQMGEAIAPIGKLFWKKFSTTGAQIGGALGSVVGGPIGAAIGSVLGGVVGGLFKKTKYAKSKIELDPLTGQLSGMSGKSNSKKHAAAATDFANAVAGGINNIAQMLGADITGAPKMTLGVRHGDYRVNLTGTSLKKKKGAKDFNGDADAAIKYAIQEAIKQGILSGISDFSQRLLATSKNLDGAVSLAASYEKILDDLALLKDPFMGEAKEFVKNLDKVYQLMAANGATQGELANVLEYRELKLKEILEENLDGLKEFQKTLNGEGSGITALNRLNRDLEEFNQLKATMAAGGIVDQDRFLELGNSIFDLAGEVYGTSTSAFQSIRQMLLDATGGMIDQVTDAYNQAVVQALAAQTAATEISNSYLAQIAANTSGGYGGTSTGGTQYGGVVGGFVNAINGGGMTHYY